MTALRQRPIGVFDSGVGGLTVLSALRRRLPREDLIYLGDTARVPYGTRSPETVIRYSRRVASRLMRDRIKLLVIACNTATAHALDDLQALGQRIGLPVVGVIDPGVRAALAASRGGRIAVLGTEGTVRTGRYQQELRARGLEAVGQACPLFVALAEEGWTEGPVAELTAQRYLGDLQEVETAILGCTHYPLLRGVIQKALPKVTLVDSAEATAEAVEVLLHQLGLDQPADTPPGTARYLVTDNLERFRQVGERFLGERPEPVSLVDLPPPDGAFGEPSSSEGR